MIDIIRAVQGADLQVQDSIAPKAGNLLATQLGKLSYEPEFGVDLRFFLESNLEFQNESFQAYLIERLIQNRINVDSVLTVIESFTSRFVFNVNEQQRTEGFIR